MNNRRPLMRCFVFSLLCLTFIIARFDNASSQTPAASPPPPRAVAKPTTEKTFLANVLKDQKGIWTAPFRWQKEDAKWGFPLGLSFATLWATDRSTSGELVEHGDNLSRLRFSKDVSSAGSFYSLGTVTAAFYLAGRARHDARARETGLLAAEALLNSNIVSQALKGVSERQRPQVDHSSGEFFDGGSSFPSGHTINSFALATIISYEYGPRHPAVRYASYAAATAIGISRFTGRRHFLSDVLAGGAMGYGIGRYVYHQHHDAALDEDSEPHTSHFTRSKFFPNISPVYSHQARVYGGSLAWNF